MSAPEPSEAELQAALEEELRRITVDDMLLQSVVSLVNLAGRRAGLVPGTAPEERDLDQLRLAIEAVRALLPLVEAGREPGQLAPIREALSQLQIAYARERGPAEGAAPAPEPEPAAPEPAPGAGGPAQSSGRLWVPGR